MKQPNWNAVLPPPTPAPERHTFRSAAGDPYVIEKDSSGELSWDFSMCENRIEALVAEIWRLKEQNDRLQESVPQ